MRLGFKRRRSAEVPRTVELREVGTCGGCMGPLCFDAEVKHASCPCGMTTIPRAFMVVASGGTLPAEP